jgi:hypothetical protein
MLAGLARKSGELVSIIMEEERHDTSEYFDNKPV